ncbi:MAG: tripartite tricarboxylate transporter substrate-binding protein [Jiangellaceae bacterium]
MSGLGTALTFVSHGPAGSGPSLMMNALAAAVSRADPHRSVEVFDLPGREGAEAICHLGDRAGETDVLGSCTPTYLTTPPKQSLAYCIDDFTAVAGLVTDTYLLAVRADHPRPSLAALFSAPTVAAASPYGGNTHIQAMLIADLAAGVRIDCLPTPRAANDAVIAGTADWTTGVGSDFAPAVKTGELRVLGTFDEPGSNADQPALAENGIDVVFPLWRGVVAPPGLSAPDVLGWEQLLAAARATGPWQTYLTRSGMQDADWDSGAFREVLNSEKIHYAGWIARIESDSHPDHR